MRKTILIVIATLAAQVALSAPTKPKTFKTPEAAVEALMKATQSKDNHALLSLLGSDAEPLIDSGDPVADNNSRERFLGAYQTAHSLDTSKPDSVTLEVGDDKWPFPIPVVKREGKWSFDSAAGAEELIDRRVGQNELDTIQSCLAYVDAQREYFMRNAQKEPLLHYASRLISTDGKKDGLYWHAASDEAPSPLGEGFAQARAEGYPSDSMKGVPFHGYIYQLLTRQGPNAHGGAYDYLVNGELLGGFAAVAFPAEYGNSGIMTFVVNHDGVVFSKDLGPDTAKLALAIDSFDPDSTWKREADDKTEPVR